MKIKLINAKFNDKYFLYKIRNSADIRHFSNNKINIDYSKHIDWFKTKLKLKNYHIFIIYVNSKKCGYIRAEKKKDTYLISISILKKFRNKKIALNSILMIEKKFKDHYCFVAEIIKKNLISRKLFLKAGYKIFKILKNKIIMKKNRKKNNLIDKIEKIRSKNNINWMDLLRLAYDKAPNETASILKKIYRDDAKISNLLKKII